MQLCILEHQMHNYFHGSSYNVLVRCPRLLLQWHCWKVWQVATKGNRIEKVQLPKSQTCFQKKRSMKRIPRTLRGSPMLLDSLTRGSSCANQSSPSLAPSRFVCWKFWKAGKWPPQLCTDFKTCNWEYVLLFYIAELFTCVNQFSALCPRFLCVYKTHVSPNPVFKSWWLG